MNCPKCKSYAVDEMSDPWRDYDERSFSCLSCKHFWITDEEGNEL